MNWNEVPAEVEGLAGVTAIDCSVGGTGATVSVVVAEVAPDAAVIVVAPWANAEARPELDVIVATEVFEDVQVTDAVMSCVELSE